MEKSVLDYGWTQFVSLTGVQTEHERKSDGYFFPNCTTLFFSKTHCHRETNSHMRHQNFQIFELVP